MHSSTQILYSRGAGALVCCWLIGLILVGQATAQGNGEGAKQPANQQVGASSGGENPASQQRGQRGGRGARGVYKAQISPHWFHDNMRFWYVNNLPNNTKEFVLVNVESGTREPAFDHGRLAASLAKSSTNSVDSKMLPFNAIEFTNADRDVEFDALGGHWKCELESYQCTRTGEAKKSPESEALELESPRSDSPLWVDPDEESSPSLEAPESPQQGRGQRGGRGNAPAPASPDGKWSAFIKDGNVFVRSMSDRAETQLSKDGSPALAYGMLQWSPDSSALIAWRIDTATPGEVYLVESSPRGGGRAKLFTRPYPLPGDKFTSYELCLFDVTQKKQLKPQVDKVDFGRPRPRWSRDGKSFTCEKVDRGHQRFRLISVNIQDGTARNLIDEKTETFIWTAHIESLRLNLVNYLTKTEEVIYVSERDGWRHMYLLNSNTGELKQITQGQYVLRGIERIDEASRQIWFQAGGKNPDQDPYFVHHYRINFDGSGLVALTEGNGEHTIQFSPDRKFIVDTYSRVDMAPVHELRRTADGKLVCKLEEADITELRAQGWAPPEVLVARGRDGKTDIWGIICRPRTFDANKKCPVIEQIYAGPQGAFTPKSFSAARRFANLTDLGFVVVQMDGMGTAYRSKAFHDVCWKNLKDAGFPDRILWHKAVAAKYPWYDIERVGITGGSAGGQNSTGGLLFHPEFYKVAVSGCGCHDNRMDKASWNEQWMGYPVGPQYAQSSNIDNAHKLRGKLLLIVGEMDSNVPPESTYRLVDALIRAGKDFDYVAVPGANHGMGGTYGARRLQDFFVRHLRGVEPPNRNG